MIRQKGFTLVEILVTLALLGIMVGVVIVVLNPASFRAKARDGRRQSDLQVVQGAVEMYYAQQGAYPSGAEATNLNTALVGGSAWTVGVSPNQITYLSRTPKDPTSGTTTPYCYTPSGAGYLLCAKLENQPDGTTGCGGVTTYNYCVQNTY